MKRTLSLMLIGLSILSMGTLAFGVTAQARTSVEVIGVKAISCTPLDFAIFTVGISGSTSSIRLVRQLDNPQTTNTTASSPVWTQGVGVFDLVLSVPAETAPGHVLEFLVAATTLSGAQIDFYAITVDCATGTILSRTRPLNADIQATATAQAAAGITPSPGAGTPLPGGTPLPSTAQPPSGSVPVDSNDPLAALYNIPNGAGIRPCAVFDVGGWGFKSVDLKKYPACEGAGNNVIVMCLTNTAEWTDLEVRNVVSTAGGLGVTFSATQHGACGVFPAFRVPGDVQ